MLEHIARVNPSEADEWSELAFTQEEVHEVINALREAYPRETRDEWRAEYRAQYREALASRRVTTEVNGPAEAMDNL